MFSVLFRFIVFTLINQGRQRLQGLNPTALKRVSRFPILNFPVTTEHVKSLLRPNTTLESEFKANRLFIVDYSNFAPYTSEKYWKPGFH